MIATEAIRLAAAHLAEGDEIPSAVASAAIPFFLVRLTAVCVERRDLGVIREFALRALAVGFASGPEMAGFLGVGQQEMDLELESMKAELFISRKASGDYQLLEKGRLAISKSGLPRVTDREAACYVNGVTRRIEQAIGELAPRRRLPDGTLVLPAVPARPPRVEELDLAGVRATMLLAKNSLPRLMEVSRLGRVVRTSNLFATGHLMVRKGAHAVPIICVDGAADSDLARRLGGHPALQALKGCIDRQEKQVRRLLAQVSQKVRGATQLPPDSVRKAIATYVAHIDADGEEKAKAKMSFLSAAKALTQVTHWASGLEFEVLFGATLMSVQSRLLVVAPSLVELMGSNRTALIKDAVRSGIKVELHLPPSESRVLDRREDLRAGLKGVQIEQLKSASEWFGFCCDDSYTVIGATRHEATSMGRFDYVFGALIVNEPEKLLRDMAVKFGGIPVTVRRKRKLTK